MKAPVRADGGGDDHQPPADGHGDPRQRAVCGRQLGERRRTALDDAWVWLLASEWQLRQSVPQRLKLLRVSVGAALCKRCRPGEAGVVLGRHCSGAERSLAHACGSRRPHRLRPNFYAPGELKPFGFAARVFLDPYRLDSDEMAARLPRGAADHSRQDRMAALCRRLQARNVVFSPRTPGQQDQRMNPAIIQPVTEKPIQSKAGGIRAAVNSHGKASLRSVARASAFSRSQRTSAKVSERSQSTIFATARRILR